MKTIAFTLIVACGLSACSVNGLGTGPLQPASSSPIPAKDGVDWTPVFKDWERACEDGQVFAAFQDQLARYDGKRMRFVFQRVTLPAPYRQATAKTAQVKNHGDYSTLYLPVTRGSYYGIPVQGIELYRGHENGILGNNLILAAPLAQVQKALAPVRYQRVTNDVMGGESGVVLSARSGFPQQTVVGCDFSN